MLSLLLELASRAASLVLSSCGETYRTILVAIVIALLTLVLKGYRAGGSIDHMWSEIKRRWRNEVRDIVVVWLVIAMPLFIYYLFFVVLPQIQQGTPFPTVSLLVPRAPDYAFAKPTKRPPAERIVIETAPSLGNLKYRTLRLSNEIMDRLYMYGFHRSPWSHFPPPMTVLQPWPKTANGIIKWYKSRTSQFRFFYLNRVIEIRNELAKLHYRDRELDEILTNDEGVKEANGKMLKIAMPYLMEGHPELGSCGDDIARRLRALALQVK